MTKAKSGDEFSAAIVDPNAEKLPTAGKARIVPTNGPILTDNAVKATPPPGEPPVIAKRPEPQFFVQFGPVGFVLVWSGLFGLHIISAAYFIAAGMVYKALPDTSLAGNLKLYSLIIPLSYFKMISVVHYIVAVAHFRFILAPIAKYLYRKLTTRDLRRKVRLIRRQVSEEVKVQMTSTLHRSASSKLVASKAKSVLTYAYALTFARNGFFGVEGNYFETIFLIRELFETSLQAYQAYQMSQLLPRRALVRFYVVVLMINCWSTPLFKKLIKHKPMQRLMCMLCDIVLDFISSIWVPVYLAITYIQLYDPEKTDFPTSFWYNDKQLVNVMNESPIILFGSAINALSRLMFSVSMLTSMEDVKDLVHKTPRRKGEKKNAYETEGPESPRTEQTTSKATSAVSSLVVRSNISSKAKALIAAGALQREKVIHWAHRIMIVCGFAVLIIQIQAEAKSNTKGCVMELRPWMLSQRACALVEMNCHTDPTLTGNLSNFETTFGDLDPLSLEHIVYRHCPQVEFAPKFKQFKNLVGMKIYNSTVTKWDEDAALTQTNHPKIVFAFYVFTNFPNATMPNGLMTDDYPVQLEDIEFVGTNIDHLPSELHNLWPKGMNMYFERGPLTSIPDEVAAMRPVGITLAGNHITDLTQAAMNSISRTLALSGNPITHLSESLNGTTSILKKLHLDSTNLSSIPMWMDEAFVTRTKVNAGRTPICTDILLKPDAPATQELLAARPYLKKVLCTDLGYDRTSFYPLSYEIRADEVW